MATTSVERNAYTDIGCANYGIQSLKSWKRYGLGRMTRLSRWFNTLMRRAPEPTYPEIERRSVDSLERRAMHQQQRDLADRLQAIRIATEVLARQSFQDGE